MTVVSEVVHRYHCANCTNEESSRTITRLRGHEWPRPGLPQSWVDLGHIGIWCGECFYKLQKARGYINDSYGSNSE